jgi:hypothetical protein
LLAGTSLESAVSAKLKALSAEFDAFKAATEELPWARAAWWDAGNLTLEDWVHADCLFRSRSLDIPGHGAAMVPVLDFANHSDTANAYFAVSEQDGSVELRLRPGAKLGKKNEITIDYSGAEKSAAEFVFSYGFLPDSLASARSFVLPLPCADDDPLCRAKYAVWPKGRSAKIFEDGEQVRWNSDWAYLSVTNEEDGLTFQVLQTNEGERFLRVVWGDDNEELDLTANPKQLKEKLRKGNMWEVFELRAVATVKGAVEETLMALLKGRDAMEEQEAAEGKPLELRPQPGIVGKRLRALEETLLLRAVETLQTQVSPVPRLRIMDTAVETTAAGNVGSTPNSTIIPLCGAGTAVAPAVARSRRRRRRRNRFILNNRHAHTCHLYIIHDAQRSVSSKLRANPPASFCSS